MRLNHPAIALLSLLLFLTGPSSAQAATYTWTGAGVNNNWSNGVNWQGNAAPNVADNSPDTLIFPSGTPQTTTNNDLPSDSRIASLVFQAGYVVNGNRIVLTDGITVQILLIGGADLNTALTLDSGAPGEAIVIAVPINQSLRLGGAIGGPSGLRKTGGGSLNFVGGFANTFDGVVTVAAGTLLMDKTLAVPSGLVVEGGIARYSAANAIAGAVTVNAPGTLDLAGFSDTIGVLNGDGAVHLGSAACSPSCTPRRRRSTAASSAAPDR